MAERRQTASLMIVARTDASHPNEPYYVMDKRSRSYIEIMLGMSVHDFYTTFEAWCISGLAGVGNSDNDRRNMLKKTARQINGLATTFACTWVSVHPNVPFKG